MAKLRSVIGASLIAVATAQAQIRLAPEENVSKEMESVYVRESTSAVEKLTLAERMEHLKEWDKSATIYQEVIAKFADRVVPIKTDDKGKTTQYASVALLVQEKLSKWPEEGIKAYRARYEDAAADLLNQAGDDRLKLSNILWNFFPTEAAKNAGLKMLSVSFEDGEFASAAWIGNRLLDLHPTLLTDRPQTLFLTALADKLCGNDEAAGKRLSELKTSHPNQTGTVRGQDVVLADELAKLLQDKQQITRVTRSDNWPMQFGSPDASMVPAQISAGGARLFSTEISATTGRNMVVPIHKQLRRTVIDELSRGNMTGVFPVIDRQELFFQDNTRVYAINLTSGLPLIGWQQTYPGDRKGIFAIDSIPTPRGKQLGITVTDKHVITILGQIDRNQAIQSGAGVKPQLYCLDRTSGKKNWSIDLSKLQLPAELSNLKEGNFTGNPLVANGLVYTSISIKKNNQFEECHLACFSEADGSFQWSTYIASVATGLMIDEEFGEYIDSTAATLAYADGRVFVQSNLGVLACLDSTEGKPIWVNLYPRTATVIARQRVASRVTTATRIKPYAINPPIISSGQIYALPVDGTDIMVYDAATGSEIRRISRVIDNRNRSEPIEMLLGIVDDQMILANPSMIYVVPWKTFDPNKTLLDNNCRYRPFSNSGSNDRDERGGIRGRPLVTATHILIPTTTNLLRLTLDKSFKIDSTYPAKGVWDENDEAPGNVIATQDHLVIAGARHVMAYADLTVVTGKLDQKIAENPGNIEPYIRYAELYIVAGKQTEAIAWLDKALAVMGGRNGLIKGKQRDQFFDLVTTYAVKLQKNNAADREIVKQLFERSRIAADSPEQKVRYELAHAASLIKENSITAAVELYQQILSDPSQRIVATTGKTSGTAARAAEDAILSLIKNNTKVYEPYEAQASTQYLALKSRADASPDEYLEIANRYPIDKTGFEALRTAASMYESAGKTREAIHTLRRLLDKARENSGKSQVLETLARLYAAAPGQLDLAIVRMKQAAELSPQATLLKPIQINKNTIPAGEPLSSALALIKTYRNQLQNESLATFKLPDTQTSKNPAFQKPEVLENITGIVYQLPEGKRHDRVVVARSDDSVLQLAAGTIKPMHQPVKMDQRPTICVYLEDHLIVSSPSSIVSISSDGKENWRLQLNKLPTIESDDEASETVVVTDPSINPAVNIENNERIFRDRQLRARFGGRVQIDTGGVINPVINGILQVQPMDILPGSSDAQTIEKIHHFKLLNDRIIFTTTSGRIACLSSETGNLLWQTEPAEQAYMRFQAIDDFVAVSIFNPESGSSDVVVIDGMTGKTLKRISPQNSTMGMPILVNMVISPDGVLVMLHPNMMQSYDLFSLDAQPKKYNIPNTTDAPFTNSSGNEQMVVADDRLLVLYQSNNSNKQMVRVYDLHALKPLRITNPNGQNADLFYPTGATSDPQTGLAFVSIRSSGSWIYAVGPRSLRAQNLNHEEWWWPGTGADANNRGPVRDLILTQNYCLMIQQSNVPNPSLSATKVPKIRIQAYSREKVSSGAESGLLEQSPDITDTAGILIGQWQVAENSFYYVNDEKKLNLLKTNP